VTGAVHVVLPDSVDDPARPSGGNTYDRHVCRGLASLGWSVHTHPVSGAWPRRDQAAFAALASVLQRIRDGSLVLLDGLIASAAPEVLVPEARRLRQVILVHMPLGQRPDDEGASARTREAAVLLAAAAVVTTSGWTRSRLLELYPLPDDRVHVAEPGAEFAELAPGTADGEGLLCVAAVTFNKGHDVLLDALETLSDLSWRCVCIGSLDREPAFARRLRGHSLNGSLDGRVEFRGARTGADLDRSYAAADLLVLPSRAETYGLVLTEALARGVPVVAAEVGGVAEAVAYGADGVRPAMLVPPGDSRALGAALRAWLRDPELRGRLRRAASERRETLSGWASTASALEAVLAAASR
jgi:glycosyltransferase involved in cell wall biosynthesis